MKRIIATLLMFSMLLSSTAFAEFTKMDGDFSIRGGVMFGMSPEEVKDIESGVPSENERNGEFCLGYAGLDSLAGIPRFDCHDIKMIGSRSLLSMLIKAVNAW